MRKQQVSIGNTGKLSKEELLEQTKLKEQAANYSFNNPWDQNSSYELKNTLERDKAANYKFNNPWDQNSIDELKQFEDILKVNDYKYRAEWVKNESSILEASKTKNINYKYESLWAEQKIPDDKLNQMKNYKVNPPFETQLNKQDVDMKCNKKIDTSHHGTTRAPWQYGNLPGDKVAKTVQTQPKTYLWDVPEPDNDGDSSSGLPSSGDPILDNLREQLRRRGASGILGLAKKFRIMDDDNSGSLDMAEFEKAMKECDVIGKSLTKYFYYLQYCTRLKTSRCRCDITDLSQKAIRHLFRFFDVDDSGSISYDEFLVGVRGELNERRKSLVLLAFQKVDRDGSGVLTIDDLKDVYDVTNHPDYINGKRTKEDLLTDFLSNFAVKKPLGSAHIQEVTQDDFFRYYGNLSASVDSDDYFELMIRNAWHIAGGKGWCENSSNRRVLVTDSKTGEERVVDIESNPQYNSDKNYKVESVSKFKNDSSPRGKSSTGGRGGSTGQYSLMNQLR